MVTTCAGPVGDSEPFCTPTVTVHGFRPGAGWMMVSEGSSGGVGGGVGGAGGDSGHESAGGEGGGVSAFSGGGVAFACGIFAFI